MYYQHYCHTKFRAQHCTSYQRKFIIAQPKLGWSPYGFISVSTVVSFLLHLSFLCWLDFVLSPHFLYFILLLFFLPAVVPCENILYCVDGMRSCLELKKNSLWQTRVAYQFWAKQLVSVPKLDRAAWIPWAVIVYLPCQVRTTR